jgi:multidrug efflux pump
MLVALGTLVLTIFLYIIVPKGFFPVQDTGVIQGISQAPQTISFEGDGGEAAGAGEGDPGRPGGGEPVVVHRRGWHQHHANSGRMSINLKPLNQRDLSAADVIRRLEPRCTRCRGSSCSCSRCRTSRWTTG